MISLNFQKVAIGMDCDYNIVNEKEFLEFIQTLQKVYMKQVVEILVLEIIKGFFIALFYVIVV